MTLHLLPYPLSTEPLSRQMRSAGQHLALAVTTGEFQRLSAAKRFDLANLSPSLCAWADRAEDMEAAAADNQLGLGRRAMGKDVNPAIELLVSQVDELERKANAFRASVNVLCAQDGLPPRYPGAGGGEGGSGGAPQETPGMQQPTPMSRDRRRHDRLAAP